MDKFFHRSNRTPHHPHTSQTRKRWNISLLVIFVLLASSLIALLAMHQIQRLIGYGAMTNNYFRAHYLAKAWLELALTEISLREAGFEMTVLSGDAIVSWNILSGYEGFEPSFTIEMQSTTNQWSGSLASGESIVIPVFLDNKELGHAGRLTAAKEEDLERYSSAEKISLDNPQHAVLFFGLFAFSGANFEMVGMISQTWTDLSPFRGLPETQGVLKLPKLRTYLTIVNASDLEVPLTIKAPTPFALADTLINVQAHYGETEVWLEAIFSEPFPSFLQSISSI